MARNLMLVPAGKAAGLFVISLGLVKALNDRNVKAVVFRPLDIASNITEGSYSVSFMEALKYLSAGKQAELVAAIVANYERLLQDTQAAVVVIEGVITSMFDQHAINAAIREALDGDICMASMGMCPRAMALVKLALGAFGQAAQERFIGGVLFNYDAPFDANEIKRVQLSGPKDPNGNPTCSLKEAAASDGQAPCACTPFAMIPFESSHYSLRACDVAKLLDVPLTGDKQVRVNGIAFDAALASEHDILLTSSSVENTKAPLVILCNGREGQLSQATINTKFSPLAVAEALTVLPVVLFNDDKERAELIAQDTAPLFDKALLDFLA